MLESNLLAKKRYSSDAVIFYPPVDASDSITVRDIGKRGLNLRRLGASMSKVVTHSTFGQAMYFDGTTGGFVSDNVNLYSSAQITISMELYMDARSNAVIFTNVSWGGSDASSLGLMTLNDGRLQLFFMGAQRLWTTVTPLNATVKIKITISGSTIAMYMNDVLQGSYTATGTPGQLKPLGLGTNYENNSSPFRGYIKNFTVQEGLH